jgi:hypothetical protein
VEKEVYSKKRKRPRPLPQSDQISIQAILEVSEVKNMDWQLSGSLENKAPDAVSFTGCRIEAFFNRLPPTPKTNQVITPLTSIRPIGTLLSVIIYLPFITNIATEAMSTI